MPDRRVSIFEPVKSVNRLADYEDIIAALGGVENAGQAIDALRTGQSAPPELKERLDPSEYAQFDRYAHGANMAKQQPGIGGALTRAASVPLVVGYEGAKKYAPWLLNAAAKLPGMETLAVDETTSPADMSNVWALVSGMARQVRDPSPQSADLRRLKLLRKAMR